MKKEFSGVWATFEFLDDMCFSIKEIRKQGIEKITTHTPCPRHEIEHALGNPQSRVPFFTLFGMFVGIGIGILLIITMTLDWILPVSGKPVVSVPVMGPILFELGVIMAIYCTVLGMVLLILRDTKKHSFPTSDKYKNYDRFMNDRFGVVVPCSKNEVDKVVEIFKKYQAEEVNREA
ncbi:MAG: DUF3341 domain-containing protein [Deltaproteobacteria bacterium]|nr:DUF3341 domain-containing protein [Deltaproteobacteria bacterium]